MEVDWCSCLPRKWMMRDHDALSGRCGRGVGPGCRIMDAVRQLGLCVVHGWIGARII